MWLGNIEKDSKRTINVRYGRTSGCYASWFQCYERFGDHSNSTGFTAVHIEMLSESRWSREWYCSWLRWTVQQQTVRFIKNTSGLSDLKRCTPHTSVMQICRINSSRISKRRRSCMVVQPNGCNAIHSVRNISEEMYGWRYGDGIAQSKGGQWLQGLLDKQCTNYIATWQKHWEIYFR